MKKKWEKIIDIGSSYSSFTNPLNIVSAALYTSAKGTNHFYEALELLAEWNPEDYKEEFEEYKKTKWLV